MNKVNYMGNVKKLLFAFLTLTLGLSLASCNASKLSKGSLDEAKDFVAQEYANFEEGYPARLIGSADGYSNNNGFGTTWNSDNVQYDNSYGMRLMLEVTENKSDIKASSGDPFISGEMRSAMSFKYGFFGTYMKPSNVYGTASTFFLYSDNPHDEIDIEFLGKDTTKVQFNYFVNDVGNNEYWYNLGFDASKEYHHYGIYWGPNELCWYVDFKPVYRLVGENTPSSSCKLIANHWAGATNNIGIMNWMGKATYADCPSYSCYKDLEIADINGEAMKVKPKMTEYDICPTIDKFESKPVAFKSVTEYTVLNRDSTTDLEVSYTKEDLTKDYRCVKLSVAGISDNKWVRFKVKNLLEADHPTLCRLTVDSSTDKGTSNNKFLNVWKDGEVSDKAVLKNSNLEAHYEIASGEEAVMTFRWYGLDANELTFMFDDFGECPTVNGQGQRDGHIYISDFMFGGVQDYVESDSSADVDELYTKNGELEDPEEDQVAIPEGFTKKSILMSSTSYYTVTNNDDGMLVEYEVGASNYEQVGYYSTNIFDGATEMIMAIKNNNSKEEHYQIKIKDATSGLVSSVEVLSNSTAGRFDRFSSSSPNIPYVYVAAGRTCQFKFYLTGEAKSFAIVAAVGGSATTGSFLIKGIYINDGSSAGTDDPASPDVPEETGGNLATKTNVSFVGTAGSMDIENDTSATLGNGVKCTVTGALTATQRHLIVGLGATYSLVTDASKKISFIMGSNMDIGEKDELQILRFYGTISGNNRRTSSSVFPMGSTITHTLLETTGGINYYQFSMTFGDFTADSGSDIDGFAIMFRNGGSIGQIAGIYNFVVE